MSYFLNLASTRWPRAASRQWITGDGPYALISCVMDESGARRIRLFHDPTERAQTLARWNRIAKNDWGTDGSCDSSQCSGNHGIEDLKLETQPQTITLQLIHA
jgi:hypothetical protein